MAFGWHINTKYISINCEEFIMISYFIQFSMPVSTHACFCAMTSRKTLFIMGFGVFECSRVELRLGVSKVLMKSPIHLTPIWISSNCVFFSVLYIFDKYLDLELE